MMSEAKSSQPGAGIEIPLGRRLILIIRKLLFNAWRIVPGVFQYHFAPHKTVCLIASPMRSGSTLLKALLAEAEDVSSLPEKDTLSYRRCSPYAIYHHMAGLAREPIIVMKRPGLLLIPFLPRFLRLKVIILCRDLAATCHSIQRVTTEVTEIYPQPWSKEEAVTYWCDMYASILGNERLWEHDVYMCRYEELLDDPIRETGKLYSFIGSSRHEGTDTYSKPQAYRWQWGSDDASDKIRSLSVQRAPWVKNAEPPAGWESFYELPRVQELRRQLGYVGETGG